MPRHCWTCGSEHDPDAACKMSGINRSRVAAGGKPDLFDDAEDAPRFGPIFMATYDGECAACDGLIVAGEDIRADGRGGWIHADDQCERVAS